MPLDRDALVNTFISQAEETLRVMEESLMALESHPDDEELIHGIFRGAHRLKGDAALLGLSQVAEFTHVFEDVLDRLRHRRFTATSAVVTALLRFIDVEREMLEVIQRDRVPAADAHGSKDAAKSLGGIKAPKSIRVDTEKLDRILNTTGEIAIHREKVREILEGAGDLEKTQMLEAHREADQLHMDLQETVMKARMVSLGPLFRPYLRTVRDLAEKLGKKVTLQIQGEEVEVDTAIVEHLRDPLTHLIRNAMDHGIERPEERAAAGKAAESQILLSAWQEAGSVAIRLQDDGRGLNRQRIKARIRAQNLDPDPERLPDAELFQFLFMPGFSTADTVTEISGRGVGLDIVRKNIENLRGSLSVESAPGKTSIFTLRVPLTLAIIQGFSMGVGDQTMILPLDAVSECLELPADRRDTDPLFGLMAVRGQPLPFVRLAGLFGLRAEPRKGRESVVVIHSGEKRAGLVVDRLYGEQQTVIKPLPRQFRGLEGISASSILGNGRIGLILDVPSLLKKTLRESAAGEKA